MTKTLNLKTEFQLKKDMVEYQAKYSIINRGGKTMIVHTKPDGYMEFQSVQDFKSFHSNKFYYKKALPGQKPVELKLVDEFLRSENTKRYEGIVFDPSNKYGDLYFNLWQGWKVKPVKGDVSLYLKVIDVICGGTGQDYFLDWNAHALQKPTEMPMTAIVFKGEQGTGKGTAARINMAFTNNSIHITNMNMLLGDFNGHLGDAYFCFVDEVTWGGDKKAEGTLKTMITEPTALINAKGKDAVQVNNYKRLMFASNEDWVVPVGEGDRRYAVYESSSELKGNTAFWTKFYNWLNHEDGYGKIFNYLMERDISNVNLLKLPVTSAKVSQQIKGLTTVQRFVYEYINQQAPISDKTINGDKLHRQGLFADYLDWAKERNYKVYTTPDDFGKAWNGIFMHDKDNEKWRTNWKDSKGYFYKWPGRLESMRRFSKNICLCHPSLVFFEYSEMSELELLKTLNNISTIGS